MSKTGKTIKEIMQMNDNRNYITKREQHHHGI